MDFKAFPKIERLGKTEMQITQKIHGTNAQIMIVPFPDNVEEAQPWMIQANAVEVDGKYYHVRAGSRTRWIFPGDDNYGFAAWCEANKVELVQKLGPGQHFGEWAGPGINSGEGLTKKTFVLFDWWKFPPERPLPVDTVVVPLLFKGAFDPQTITTVAELLKKEGSVLVPGFMRPEGVVVQVLGTRLKKVFDPEETQWKKPSKEKSTEPKTKVDVSHLLQPIRLEKLLSRDERYLREYPASLPQICSDYTADLMAEGQIVGDEDQIKATRKAMGSSLFGFIKSEVSKRVA